MNEANNFLKNNKIDAKNIDTEKFYESFAKMYLASGMNNEYLYKLAYDDMLSALTPKRDKNGNLVFERTKSPDVASLINKRDIADYNSGNYSTTAFTNNTFNLYSYLLQQKLNVSGVTDQFGNKLNEDGVYGPKTQMVYDSYVWLSGNKGLLLLSSKAQKKPNWRGNSNTRHGSENRQPSGARERNVGHPDAEEHGIKNKNKGKRKPKPVPSKKYIETEKVEKAIIGGIAVAGVGYLIYRGVRLLPSMLPPLWWTVPANLVTP